MKVLPILVTFCLLQVLMCVSLEVTVDTLNNAVKKSAPFLKVFHQETLSLGNRDTLSNVQLHYPVLGSGNIQFKFDDFGLLHIKYVNLRLRVSGNNRARVVNFSVASTFNAELSNFVWEQVYAVKLNEKADGKIELKKTKTSESQTSFNINKLTSKTVNSKIDIKEIETNIKVQIKLLNFEPLRQQLRKITELIFETLQADLNK